MKICRSCTIEKENKEFSPARANKDGLSSYCHLCSAERTRLWKKKRVENGRCPCGSNPIPGLTSCQSCLDRNQLRYQERKEQGKCAKCNRLPESGKVLCRNHLEIHRQQSKLTDPEKRAIASKKSREKHYEKRRDREKRYAKEHPELARIYSHNRRARIANAEGRFTNQEWTDLCSQYNNKCLACGDTPSMLSPDHVIPLARGGANNIGNIQPLCFPCNMKKGLKIIDYRAE